MTDLPGITDIQRYHYQPGDALIVRTDRTPTLSEIGTITARIRAVLKRPGLPVLVHGPEAAIDVINLADAGPPA